MKRVARPAPKHARRPSTTLDAMLRDARTASSGPKPDKFSHFALEDEHELVLTNWMNERLELAVWVKPAECVDLHVVEVGVLRKLVPPLNMQDNSTSSWLKQVRAARRVMADDARAWTRDMG